MKYQIMINKSIVNSFFSHTLETDYDGQVIVCHIYAFHHGVLMFVIRKYSVIA